MDVGSEPGLGLVIGDGAKESRVEESKKYKKIMAMKSVSGRRGREVREERAESRQEITNAAGLECLTKGQNSDDNNSVMIKEEKHSDRKISENSAG